MRDSAICLSETIIGRVPDRPPIRLMETNGYSDELYRLTRLVPIPCDDDFIFVALGVS